MIRAWLVVSLGSAGVSLLASPGWGLLAAALLTYVMWPRLTDLAPVTRRLSVTLAAARRAAHPRRRTPGGLGQSVGYWG